MDDFDKSGRFIHHHGMSEIAAPETQQTQDEALLASLFARLEPSPVSLLRAALRFAAKHPAAITPDLILNALQLRGAQGAAEWLEKVGPTLGVQEAAQQTGLSKSGLHKAKSEDRVLALRLQDENFDRFPLFQFRAGKVRDWVAPLLAKTGNGLPAAHFLAIDRKRLGNCAYLDLLRDRDEDDVIAQMLRHADGVGDEARSIAAASTPNDRR